MVVQSVDTSQAVEEIFELAMEQVAIAPTPQAVEEIFERTVENIAIAPTPQAVGEIVGLHLLAVF